MDNSRNKVERYIDSEIISEHASKSFRYGYSFDIQTLSQNEKENFLDILFNNDPILQELVLDRMQEIVDMRLPRVESQDRYYAGLKPQLNAANGEVTWVVRN